MKAALVCSLSTILLLGLFSYLDANVRCNKQDCPTRCVACVSDTHPIPTARCELCPPNSYAIYGDKCIPGQCRGVCTFCKSKGNGPVYLNCNTCLPGDSYSPA